MFRRNVLPLHKRELGLGYINIVHRMLMSAYNTTQYQNPDDSNLNLSYVC